MPANKKRSSPEGKLAYKAYLANYYLTQSKYYSLSNLELINSLLNLAHLNYLLPNLANSLLSLDQLKLLKCYSQTNLIYLTSLATYLPHTYLFHTHPLFSDMDTSSTAPPGQEEHPIFPDAPV